MRLQLGNKIISGSIETILKSVRDQSTDNYLKDIIVKKEDVVVTCPFHGDHVEKKPACNVVSVEDSELEFGSFHCFACGESGRLPKLVAKCFQQSEQFARDWLVENYGDVFVEEQLYLDPIELNSKEQNSSCILPESFLDQFDYNNADAIRYLTGRKIPNEVQQYFKLGYDKESDSVTFPCRDSRGKLLGVSKRCIHTKKFEIPKVDPKPVYLLDEAIKNNYQEVIVCESQIDALTAYTYGKPAVALFGSGTSDEQMRMLNKSGIFHFILMYDGDEAGRHGANRFKKLVDKSKLVTDIILPKGKDINTLTKEEFLNYFSRHLL